MKDERHSLKDRNTNSVALICSGTHGESADFPVCTNLLLKITLHRFGLFLSQTQITPETTKQTTLGVHLHWLDEEA